MNSPEENIDKLIRDALSTEEAQAYDELGEQNLLTEALRVLSGRMKYMNRLVVFVTFIWFILTIYSAFQFFATESVKELIMWAVIFLFSMSVVSALKLWYWMEMNKNATIRELKRVELQVSHLAKAIEAR